MVKKKTYKNEQEVDNNDSFPNQINEFKLLVTDGTVGIHSNYGLVDIRNGSLKISPSFLSQEFEIGIGNTALLSSPAENVISIKGGILNASPSLTLDQSNIFKTRVDNDLLSISNGSIYTSPIRDAMFGIHSQPTFLGISEQTLAIRDAAFTISPHTTDNALTIKDGVFALSNESRLSLVEGVGVINSINNNLLTIRDGALIPNPNMAILTGENSFLKFDAIQGALVIKEEAYKLTADFPGASQVVIQTQKTLSGIDWLNAGNGIGVDILDQSRIQESFLGLSKSYSDLLLATEAAQPLIVSLPKSVAEISSIEYLHSANLLSQATYIKPSHGSLPAEEHIVDEIDGYTQKELLAQLEKMDAGLKIMFQGAVYALNSRNPDRVRHFSTSLRELFTHVLHKLSPDNEIRRWSKSKEDFDNGKPTRRARLLYICREINQDSFERFLSADVKALLEFINLFQGGTHSIQPDYTEKQMKAMLMRMESTLRFLIEISRC